MSCYGYGKKTTPNIDKVAENGVLFENNIASACFTPICMSSVLTGCYPDKTTVHDPYCKIQRPTLARILKDNGYKTGGFSGSGVLSTDHGFADGFDIYDEPNDQSDHHEDFATWKPDATRRSFYGGNWWVDRFHEWLEKNHEEQPFFVWGHLYHTHRGGEGPLLEMGILDKEKDDPWMFYYDAKLKIADELVMGKLLENLEKWGIAEDTTVIFMSDHGTNLNDRPAKVSFYYDKDAPACPCHLNLYDINIKTACVIKDRDLPKGIKIPGQIRSIDVIPTVLDLLDIPSEEYDMDGKTLVSDIKAKKVEGRLAYSENLNEWETEDNALRQSLRTDDYHFIRNLADGTEEWYDIVNDPKEHHNIIEQVRVFRKEDLMDLRKTMNDKILKGSTSNVDWSDEEKGLIADRLSRLGYNN